MSDKLTSSTKITVPAELVLVPEYGDQRPATEDDLRGMGWVHRDDIYDSIMEKMRRVGLDPSEEHSDLRSFIEYASGFWEHDITDEELTGEFVEKLT